MINIDIPKEIKQENKVLLGFTIRQLICLGIAAVVSLVLMVILGFDFDIAQYPLMGIGVLVWLFGWKKFDGMPAEKVVIKKIQQFVYLNDKRRYKTKNKYVTLVNKEYRRRENIDMTNKKVKRAVKKDSKKKASKSTLKAIK